MTPTQIALCLAEVKKVLQGRPADVPDPGEAAMEADLLELPMTDAVKALVGHNIRVCVMRSF